jgi:hypothetical protein
MTPLDTERVESLSLSSKPPVFARLEWNSYGTEGAQPVAKLRLAKEMVRRGSTVRVRQRAFREDLQVQVFVA